MFNKKKIWFNSVEEIISTISLFLTTTSASATWSPVSVTNPLSPPVLNWNLNGSVVASYDADDPIIDLSTSGGGETYMEVKDVTGITYINMPTLNIKEINVVNMTMIENLRLPNNQLTSLDVTKNILIDELRLSSNFNLVTIDISNNTLITYLDVTNCGLTSLDVTGLNILNYISVSGNPHTSVAGFDTSSVSNVVTLTVQSSGIISFDSTYFTSLETLTLNLFISTVDFSLLTSIKSIIANATAITNLDLSSNGATITSFVGEFGDIETVDVDGCTLMNTLRVAGNNITSITTTSLPACTFFNISNNNMPNGFSALKVPQVSAKFYVNGNNYTEAATNQMLADLVTNGFSGTLRYRNNETGQGVTDRAQLITNGASITNYAT